MIVDDEESFRTTFADILDARGYECRSAATVQDALVAVSREAADVYLVDLKLPDGSGLDVLSRVREAHPDAETIILTGFSSLSTAVQSLNLGAFGYLEKPYNIDRLFIALERALDRQRLVRRLHHSETAYSRLFSVSGAAVFMLDSSVHRIRSANPAFSRLLGYSPDEVAALDPGKVLPAAVVGRLRASRKFLSSPPPAGEIVEAPLKRRDGSEQWFSISIVRLAEPGVEGNGDDDSRSGTEFLLVCNDMSSARQEVSAMEKHRNFLETVVSAIPSGIAIIDQDYRITYANPAYCRFLELDPEQVLQRRCHEVLSRYQSPCSLFGELCPITAARTNGAVGRVYRDFPCTDGHRRQVEYSANPFRDPQGNITSFVVVINDISDLRAAESRIAEANERLGRLNTELSLRQQELEAQARQLRLANVELLKLSNAKGEFVATVSHELRTPLTAITEGINLVGDGSLGELNPDQQAFLKLALRNGRRLAELINDLLDLSKIEAGKLELTPRVVDAARFVEDVVATYANLAREKELALNAEVPANIPAVIADPQALQRILVNLVGNALKFTPAGGTITVCCRAGQDDSATCPAEVVISVKDTGIGIPNDQQNRIFGKFEQVAQSDGMRPQGTGLGLALTRQLVEMNQGRIWFESEEGRGTRFHFTLPRHEEHCYLQTSLRRFIDQTPAPDALRRPALYLFELVPPVDSTVAPDLLAQVEELVRPRLTHTDTIVPMPSHRSLFVLASAALAPERYRALLDSLQGASLFLGSREVRVGLRSGMLEPAADGAWPDQLLALRDETDPGRTHRLLSELLQPTLQEVR
jgi:PAS domain S-box-containing protein